MINNKVIDNKCFEMFIGSVGLYFPRTSVNLSVLADYFTQERITTWKKQLVAEDEQFDKNCKVNPVLTFLSAFQEIYIDDNLYHAPYNNKTLLQLQSEAKKYRNYNERKLKSLLDGGKFVFTDDSLKSSVLNMFKRGLHLDLNPFLNSQIYFNYYHNEFADLIANSHSKTNSYRYYVVNFAKQHNFSDYKDEGKAEAKSSLISADQEQKLAIVSNIDELKISIEQEIEEYNDQFGSFVKLSLLSFAEITDAEAILFIFEQYFTEIQKYIKRFFLDISMLSGENDIVISDDYDITNESNYLKYQHLIPEDEKQHFFDLIEVSKNRVFLDALKELHKNNQLIDFVSSPEFVSACIKRQRFIQDLNYLNITHKIKQFCLLSSDVNCNDETTEISKSKTLRLFYRLILEAINANCINKVGLFFHVSTFSYDFHNKLQQEFTLEDFAFMFSQISQGMHYEYAFYKIDDHGLMIVDLDRLEYGDFASLNGFFRVENYSDELNELILKVIEKIKNQ